VVTAGDSGSGGQPRLQWRLLTHPHVALDGQRRPPRPTRTSPPPPYDDRRTALPRCGQMKDELRCLRVSINPPPFVVTTLPSLLVSPLDLPATAPPLPSPSIPCRQPEVGSPLPTEASEHPRTRRRGGDGDGQPQPPA